MSRDLIRVPLKRTVDDSYDILIGTTLARAAKEMHARWPGSRKFIITDSNVGPLYGKPLARSFRQLGEEVPVIVFPSGEASKSRAARNRLEDALLERGVSRDSLVIALGGGVAGDLAGAVAATLLRGIGYVQVPTTLLAQVDSSVGGKVAVDHPCGKNLIGSFHQPRRVYIDLTLLGTLPEREFRNGLAEVIKYAAVMDRPFFAFLEKEAPRILRREISSLSRIVRRSCALKSSIVARDERDNGLRQILNFGHTIGHALEAHSGYGVPHGEAVAIGMALEAALSVGMGLAPKREALRLASLLTRYGLPVSLPKKVSLRDLLPFIDRDKKGSGGAVRYTLLRRIGSARRGIQVTHPTLLTHCAL